MEYRICEAKSTRALQEEVNRLIGEGWTPLGGIAVTHGDAWWYYQAMTRSR